MPDAARARAIALGLPETVERDHHGFPSYRVHQKIFATEPDPQHLNVMIAPEDIRVAVAENPDCCAERYWGKRLAAVQVDLTAVDEALLAELITDAWRRKAPRRLTEDG
ncbi:MAG: MmcQ/YjbR family DNA-binding protein [Mycobacteriales bacterium]|nr:MAG: hypothetical protein DLM56_01550 [Pseudonocardiales bacterium]